MVIGVVMWCLDSKKPRANLNPVINRAATASMDGSNDGNSDGRLIKPHALFKHAAVPAFWRWASRWGHHYQYKT